MKNKFYLLLALSLQGIAFAQAPIIKYDTSQKFYAKGTAITPLVPTNSGGEFGKVTTFAVCWNPYGVAVDASGNLYVDDTMSNQINKISPTGVVTGVASGNWGTFINPQGLALDASGNLYVAGYGYCKITMITPARVISILAGSGCQEGAVDGTGTAATFKLPQGVAVDASGNVYVADTGDNKIRMITPAGMVSTIAGSGAEGSSDGIGAAASFYNPTGVAVDASGNVYIADTKNNKIRKITLGGIVSTFAGSGIQGSADGSGTAAQFYGPQGVAVDASGNVYVADSGNNKIRKITPAGDVSTWAGSGTQGSDDGTSAAASFYKPTGIAVDASGNLYVADSVNNKIRKIDGAGGYSVTPQLPAGLNIDPATGTISGTPTTVTPETTYTVTAYNSYGTSTAVIAIVIGEKSTISYPTSQTYRVGTIITEVTPTWTGSQLINYSITPSLPTGLSLNSTTGTISGTPTVVLSKATYTVTATSSYGTCATTTDITVINTGTDVTDICFNHPSGITIDSSGNFYVGDTGNYKIKKITPTGEVTTYAGGGSGGNWDGTIANAVFYTPTMVASAHQGNVYVLDRHSSELGQPSVVREITPAGGVATILEAPPASSGSNNVTGVAGDALGNLYVNYTYYGTGGQFSSNLVKITPDGVTSTVSTDMQYGGISNAAMTLDAQGNIYRTDGCVITKITPFGVVTKLAGGGLPGDIDGLGTAARFNNPHGVAVDTQGNVYVSDTDNNKIKKITPAGAVTTLAGSGFTGSANGIGSAASFNSPMGMTIDTSGNLYVADQQNNLIRKVTPTGVVSTFAGATCTLAVEDVTFKNIVVYPNPTKGEVNISNVMVEKVTVYNNAGQLVKTVINSEAANTTTVQLNNLPTGIYYLNIEAENECVVKQIIKE